MEASALSAFLAHLPKNGRVLVAGGDAATWFEEQGCSTEIVQRDLRLLTLPRESFDGIWCEDALASYPIDDCQRILQSFFQGLRSRGMLFVSILEGSGRAGALHRFGENAFLSLLRQNGFAVELRGERTEGTERRLSLIARRV